MSETQTPPRHPKPPRLARTLINTAVTAILRSRWHRVMSPRLLLITFMGRKSGKAFTAPIRYTRDGETLVLKILVEHSWWKNLVEETTVQVLLRGQMRRGTAEVLSEEAGIVVVKVHVAA